VTVHTARPGVVIGKRGSEVDKLRDELGVLTKSEVSVNVEEVKRPELDAVWWPRTSPTRSASGSPSAAR
jgi:small subunit ribosomal protein S3